MMPSNRPARPFKLPKSYAALIADWPVVVLGMCTVLIVVCALVGILVPDLPDFSDPLLLDNLKSTIQRKKQNGFARSKMKTWMKSCKQLEKGKKMLEKQIAEHGAPLKEQKPSMG
ncbi:protein dispatched homolog 2-like [Chrysemys picta bellii]|uniref:protein dispatched homolog 2-like n=1 Tax=Chrysemys picta bellii TaxID=8478 RepID=UPI0032B27190